jgi:hypothetical protein
MSQTTFDEDDLFGEAAEEMRSEVEEHLDAARAALPTADAIWDVEAENTLGVLNSLRSALDTGDAAEQLRQAKKQYVMGERADAFEDADDLEAAIDELEAVIEDIEDAHEDVGDLAGTIPGLRSALQDANADADEDDE